MKTLWVGVSSSGSNGDGDGDAGVGRSVGGGGGGVGVTVGDGARPHLASCTSRLSIGTCVGWKGMLVWGANLVSVESK